MKLQEIAEHADPDNPVMVKLLQYWIANNYGPVQGRILMALFAGRPVGKTELVKWVWPSRQKPPTLDVSLRVAISKLRSRLERDNEPYEIIVRRPNLSKGRKETVYQMVEYQPVSSEEA